MWDYTCRKMERVVNSYPDPSLSDFLASDNNLSLERETTFRTLSAPVTLQWELTPFCNERCIHCYNFWRGPQAGEKLVVDSETLAIYDRASREIVGNKVFYVTVTGGEPLAVLKQTYPYLQRLAENGVSISFNTNLTMFTREKAQTLKRLGVRSILTSLMSGDPNLNDELANRPNTHHDVSRGIKLALDEGFWVGANMVVTKRNLYDIFSTAEYVKSLGVTGFSATKAATPINSRNFSEYVLSRKEFQLMISELEKVKNELGLTVDSLEFYPPCTFDIQESRDLCANHVCTAGKTTCTIGFDGQVRPCSHAVQIYGSILEENGLKQAWENLHPWRTDIFIPMGCDGCILRNACGGGCRSEAYAVFGSLKAPDPYCDFSRQPLLTKQKVQPEVNKNAKFVFRSDIKARPEIFGGILFLSPREWLAVDLKLYNYCVNIKQSPFKIDELADMLSVGSEEIESTIKILLSKSIIRERG